MRACLTGVVVLFLAACSDGHLAHPDPQPIRVSPVSLDFGRVALRFTAAGTLEIQNPNSYEVSLTATLTGPFVWSNPPSTVPAGSSLTVEIDFTPTVEGAVTGSVVLDQSTVTLSAEGFDPHCPSTACSPSQWDPATAACAAHAMPDGTDCSGSLACLSHATCSAGQCVGTVINCDDQNPCTLDVCGTTGCGHVDALPFCPEPSDPCQVPACSIDAGCGATAAPDGTSCGPRDCTNALVCINGACVTRAVPGNQACVDVVAGVPAGIGTADGTSRNARFRGLGPAAYDTAGNRYQVDQSCIRKITPSGNVTTLAGVVDSAGWVDGFGRGARFLSPNGLVFDGVNLVVYDDCALRKVTLAGLVSTWVGDLLCTGKARRDGIGTQAELTGVGNANEALTLSPTGSLWFVDADDKDLASLTYWLREVNPNGEVFTRGQLALPHHEAGDTIVFQSLVATPEGRLFASYYSALGPSMQTLDHIVEVQPNGSTSPTGYPYATTILKPGTEGFLGAGIISIEQYLPDGGQLALAQAPEPGYANGPADAGKFEFPGGLAVNAAGDISFFDALNHDVRLLSNGMLTTLAGPHPDRRIEDGAGPVCRLQGATAVTSATSGTAYFTDDHAIRRLDTNGICSTIVSSDGGTVYDGPFGSTGMNPKQLAVLPAGDLLFSDDNGLRLAQLSTASVTTVQPTSAIVSSLAVDSSGDWAWVQYDTGASVWVQPAGASPLMLAYPGPQWVTADPRGGFFLDEGCSLDHLSASGNGTVVDSMVCRDFTSNAASFDAAGNLYLIDAYTNALHRIDPHGVSTTVLELADHPTALAAEPSGSVLILVPDALLRYRP